MDTEPPIPEAVRSINGSFRHHAATDLPEVRPTLNSRISSRSTYHSTSDSPADLEMTSPSPSPARRRRASTRTHSITSTTSASPTVLPSTVSASPLFLLPRELRTQIYLYVLSTPLGINYPQTSPGRNLTPSLLRTNSLLYAEAAPLLYAANRPIFSHPSDANVFVHAIADSHYAREHIGSIILRIKSVDTRLWTSYFNSNAPERGLNRDFPKLRLLHVRFRGVRYVPSHSPEENVRIWLRDHRLVEVILSVRKCVSDVQVELCVKVPEQWPAQGVWAETVNKIGVEIGERPEGGWVDVPWRLKEGWAWLSGVWIKLETEGT